jgi:uncharacterized protein (TIGR00725 family)
VAADVRLILHPAVPEGKEEVQVPALRVAVFGAADGSPGERTWELAHSLGRLLGAAGIVTISGGYQGTMEAVSRGARETNGAVVEGVLLPSAFPKRLGGNQFLTREIKSTSLFNRLELLCKQIDAYIVLPGSTGTLTELSLVWNLSVICVYNGLPPLPIFVMADPWQAALTALSDALHSEQRLKLLTFVGSTEADLAQLVERIKQLRSQL